MITIDFLLKALPLILAIFPLLVWLDRSKRFTHRRKYYLNRLEAINHYLEHYYQSAKQKVQKDSAAHLLICSDKLGYLDVDYVLQKHPQRFFYYIDKLVIANDLIKPLIIDGEITLTSQSCKKRLKKVRWALVLIYLLGILIIKLNNILVFMSQQFGWFTLIEVSSLTLLIGMSISLVLGIIVCVISGILFRNVDAAIEIYDALAVQHIIENEQN